MSSPQLSPRPITAHRSPTSSVTGITGKTEDERIAQALLSPDLFSEYFLQTKLWSRQRMIMQAVATKPRVAVKACHSSSKTFSAAHIALWFIARYPEAVCVTTAPTWVQVEKLLWGEVHSALLKSYYPFPKATMTEIKLGPKRYAYGLSTSVTKQDEGVKFQGIHAAHVLVILDEAPGVDPKIWEAIEGARAGGTVTVLAIGNPTISSGPFHDAFSIARSGWDCHTIDAFDTPNLEGLTLETLLKLPDSELDNNVCPYLTTRRWVVEKYYEWGVDHPSWESRVRGNFPKQSEDALMNLTWLEEAAIRQLQASGPISAGLDVAGPGEAETVLTIRQGSRILRQDCWAQSDPRGEVVAVLNPYRPALEAINVDAIGIGWGMYQHLVDLKFPARAVNVSEASSDPEKYFNQKAEYYWNLRERAKVGDLCGALDETTISQLAGIRYKHNPRGQVQIESKEEAAKRGVRSPDRAESIMLAFADHILVYGVNEYCKELQEKAELEKVLGSQLMKPAMNDRQLACPKCAAVCVVRVSSGWRCSQCGEQWQDSSDQWQSLPGPSRTDMLLRKKG